MNKADKEKLDAAYDEFCGTYSKWIDDPKYVQLKIFFVQLKAKRFPLIPTELEYMEAEDAGYEYFSIMWVGKFFVHIPVPDTDVVWELLCHLVSTNGGPRIKFPTVLYLADHLIDNQSFYENEYNFFI